MLWSLFLLSFRFYSFKKYLVLLSLGRKSEFFCTLIVIFLFIKNSKKRIIMGIYRIIKRVFEKNRSFFLTYSENSV